MNAEWGGFGREVCERKAAGVLSSPPTIHSPTFRTFALTNPVVIIEGTTVVSRGMTQIVGRETESSSPATFGARGGPIPGIRRAPGLFLPIHFAFDPSFTQHPHSPVLDSIPPYRATIPLHLPLPVPFADAGDFTPQQPHLCRPSHHPFHHSPFVPPPTVVCGTRLDRSAWGNRYRVPPDPPCNPQRTSSKLWPDGHTLRRADPLPFDGDRGRSAFPSGWEMHRYLSMVHGTAAVHRADQAPLRSTTEDAPSSSPRSRYPHHPTQHSNELAAFGCAHQHQHCNVKPSAAPTAFIVSSRCFWVSPATLGPSSRVPCSTLSPARPLS